MPRTTTLEAPGCPSLRALTFDSLGLIKGESLPHKRIGIIIIIVVVVIIVTKLTFVEARGKQKLPQVVDRWGTPDSSRYVLAASIADHKSRPVCLPPSLKFHYVKLEIVLSLEGYLLIVRLVHKYDGYEPFMITVDLLLAVARKNGLIFDTGYEPQVELVNPLNGDIYVAMEVSEADTTGHIPEDNLVSELHVFKKDLPRSSALLACTVKGIASLRSIEVSDTSVDFTCSGSPTTWNVCATGKILCSSIDGNEKYAVFGGKGVEVRVWDLEKVTQFWTAKHPPSNSNGLFSPTWFTATTFLSKDDCRKIVAGTNNHQVRLYDVSAQRRPVISFDFRESPIKVVTEDPDGHTVYVGNGCGDLASFDMRTGLDSWLRFWDTKTRKPLAAVFLKQHLNSVVIDANFKDEEVTLADTVDDEFPEAAGTMEQPKELQTSDHTEDEDYTGLSPPKRKKSGKSLKKDHSQKVKTSKQKPQESNHIQIEGDEKSDSDSESLSLKRRKTKSKNKTLHKKVTSEVDSSESEGTDELLQQQELTKSEKRDQHKKVKFKHKSSDHTLMEEEGIDYEAEEELVHTKHKKLSKSKSRDRDVKSKPRKDMPEQLHHTDADGTDKSEIDDGSLHLKRKKSSKSEVRGQQKARSKNSKKRSQNDS
ncbi:hypothetical protein ACLOJK_009112 [Asimina triloba]